MIAKQMVERFGRGHAGQALTQLPSRPYSYLVDMVMDNYAYTYAMSNRLLGYMQIKGVTSLRPTGPPILCPMKCKNADLRGGLHAVTCKKLGQHTRTHSALESLVFWKWLEMLWQFLYLNNARRLLFVTKSAGGIHLTYLRLLEFPCLRILYT